MIRPTFVRVSGQILAEIEDRHAAHLARVRRTPTGPVFHFEGPAPDLSGADRDRLSAAFLEWQREEE